MLASDGGRAADASEKLVYLDGHQDVVNRSRMSPSLGRNLEAMDPIERSQATG
jgi:hypothetical protein